MPAFTSELSLAFFVVPSPQSSEVAHAPGMGEKLPGAVSTPLLPRKGGGSLGLALGAAF